MPDWAGMEKASERLARWRREDCPPCVKRPNEKEGPARFVVAPDDDRLMRNEHEQFSCARHLPRLISFFALRGFDSVVSEYRLEGEEE